MTGKETADREKVLKVLMIGNSFSVSAGKYLPRIVHSAGKCRLLLANCYIGGCSLATHWKHICTADADPSFTPYRINIWRSDSLKKEVFAGNVNAMLLREKWDVVTIQQASLQSMDYANYQPWGNDLIARIRQDAPQARIFIQQIWSYRADDHRLNGEWHIDNAQMFDRIREACRRFSAETGLSLIPTGEAVAEFRRRTPVTYVPATAEELTQYHYPDLPRQAGEVVGRTCWKKNAEGRMVMTSDTIHLADPGEYLQACVWFGFLYGLPVTGIRYVPPTLDRDHAAFLRECAAAALR